MGITQVKKSETKNMLDIHFSNGDIVAVYEEDYYTMHLYDKENFTQADIADIKRATDERFGRAYAIKLILYKKRTKKEIQDKLIDKEIEQQTIDKIIQKLEKEGYVNDTLYAEKLIKRMKAQNKSKKQIELEFLMKGLKEQENLLYDYDFDEQALQNLLNKKFDNKDLNDQKIKIKVYNFLKMKGFDYEIIRKYVKI